MLELFIFNFDSKQKSNVIYLQNGNAAGVKNS